MIKEIAIWGIVGVIAVAGSYFVSHVNLGNPVSAEYESCVETMQKAIPDANDDIGRASYLKDCSQN